MHYAPPLPQGTYAAGELVCVYRGKAVPLAQVLRGDWGSKMCPDVSGAMVIVNFGLWDARLCLCYAPIFRPYLVPVLPDRSLNVRWSKPPSLIPQI